MIFHVKLAVDIYRVLYYNNFKKAKETNVYYREGELYEYTSNKCSNVHRRKTCTAKHNGVNTQDVETEALQ